MAGPFGSYPRPRDYTANIEIFVWEIYVKIWVLYGKSAYGTDLATENFARLFCLIKPHFPSPSPDGFCSSSVIETF